MNNEPLSIIAITKYLKHRIENDSNLQNIYLKGEISNFKSQSTRGHLYFSLKDEYSKINAIMFSTAAASLTFIPEDGMKVVVRGKISLYEQSGSYQIYISSMEEDGQGNLYLAFEKLKKQLETEGLFSSLHKKNIPSYPKKIGIITASTGAAIKDILTTIKRRYPLTETILFPTLVQGNKAAGDIVKNIQKAQEYDIDVLIVGRGGGSIEDLWCFNEEIVARAIYASKIPIISAVGHEVDFTISDFVADLRAATPTAAAELATPNIYDIKNLIDNYKKNLSINIKTKLTEYNKRLTNIKSSYILVNPLTLYNSKEIQLDTIIDKLNNNINIIITKNNTKLAIVLKNIVFKNPATMFNTKEQIMYKLISKLEVLNPMKTLQRGYSIIKQNDICIASCKNLKTDDNIDIILNDGIINATIVNIKENI